MLSRYEQFSTLISGLYRSIQKIEREEMVKYGFKGAYAQYLAAMNRHPDGVTSAQLSEICDRDKAAVSRAVADMETKGLVLRRGEKDNLYRARLTLTDTGRQAADFVSRRGQEAVDAAAQGMTEDDRKILYATLALISTNLQNICKNGLPAAGETAQAR